MKHKSNIYLTLTCVTLACISLAGCVKELGLTRFGIAVEQYGGGGKLVVTTNGGVSSAFVAGDTIRINGQKGVVAGDADGLSVTFSETVTPVNDKYHALYPASLFTSQGADGSIAVDLPSEYNYEEDGSGNQLIDIPLAAVSGNKKLLFRHLTGALVVLVSPVADANIVLDYIMVESSGTPLHGTGTVTFVGDGTPTLSLANDADKRHVTMFFPTAAYATLHSSDSAKRILIPVPAVPESNRFTITVCAHSTSNIYNYYMFHQQQDEQHAGALLRHEVGFVPINNLTSQRFVGSGTANDPYIISNKMDYRRFLKFMVYNSMNGLSYKLDHDIDFKGETIASTEEEFRGAFNGDGHRISNATVTSKYDGSAYVHLSIFPRMNGGYVHDLEIKEIILNCEDQNFSREMLIGGLTCWTYGTASRIENITIYKISMYNNTLNNSPMHLGGLIGKMASDESIIRNCHFILNNSQALNIHSYKLYYGGLVGSSSTTTATISDCSVSIPEGLSFTETRSTDYRYVGGIIGTINSGSVSLSNITAQGLIGYTGISTNIKKICGNAAANSITASNVNMDNLTVQRRNNSSSTWTTITDLY